MDGGQGLDGPCRRAERAAARRWWSIGLRMVEQLGAELCQGARQQPRDVHLGDADALSDLGLSQLAEEPQHHDHALAFGQLFQQWAQGVAVLDAFQLLVEIAEALDRRVAGVRIDRIQRARLPVGLRVPITSSTGARR